MPVKIRPAQPDDVEPIFSLIGALADYERAAHQVTGNPDLLREALFGPRPHAEVLIAERDGEPVGFALYFGTFSTWECRPGIYLEDLYVSQAHRRTGVGEALFAALAQVAQERGCARLEWVALNWNEPAIRFYERQSARPLDEWVTYRLEGAALDRAAALASAT